MKLPRNARIFQGQLDVAPFAGVFFLLLMFLVFRSALVYPPGVRIELPSVRQPLPGPTNRTVTVGIDGRGAVYLASQFVASSNLASRLSDLRKQSLAPVTLVIQADQGSTMQRWASVMDAGLQAGYDEIVLATRQREFAPRSGGATQ